MPDPVYQIRDWQENYENNRSRGIKLCTFVCVPNKQHGEGLLGVLSAPDGWAIYGFWCLLLGSASQHPKPRDGWLTSDGTPTGTPWTPKYLAMRYRGSSKLASKSLDLLSSNSVGWIAVRDSRTVVRKTGTVVRKIGTVVRNIEEEVEVEVEVEQEGKEKATLPHPRFGKPAREVFGHWVEVFGKDPNRSTFRASSKRYKKVVARLKDGKTVEELKQAVDGCYSDEWWRETGNHDLTKICESDEWVERFIEMATKSKVAQDDGPHYDEDGRVILTAAQEIRQAQVIADARKREKIDAQQLAERKKEITK